MSLFGTICRPDSIPACDVWRPAVSPPSPPSAGPDRTGPPQSRSVGGSSLVLSLALLGFPFPEAIGLRTIDTKVR